MIHRPLLKTALPVPAAGSDWSFTPSQTDRCKVSSVIATLVTGAAVPTRSVALALRDRDGQIYWEADLNATMAASLSATFAWAKSTGTTVASVITGGEHISAPFPDLILEPGDTILSVTSGLAAADQWSAPLIKYRVGHVWTDLELYEQIATQLGG